MSSVADWQARQVPAAPLTAPGFYVNSGGPVILLPESNVPLNLEYGNNEVLAFDNVVLTLTDVSSPNPTSGLTLGGTPENIGLLPSASVGFSNFNIITSGPSLLNPAEVEFKMTGEQNGDTYEASVVFTVQW